MSKVAKLVYSSFVTRVIVDENASEDDIIATAKVKLREQINDLGDNVEDIINDVEVPFDSERDDNQ